jgi:3-deoxy-D-manno-octulosonate 8-phosphate phosphatase (KDO 8-P phosphatase)
MQDLSEKAAKIRLLIFDVDGVLTNGALYIGDDGQEYKAFHSQDGHGLRMVQATGVKVAIITGRTSKVVEHRVRDLGINHVYQGRRDKLPAFQSLLEEVGLPPDAVAYVGDDVVDLPVMVRVGLAVAVQNAHPLVKKHAHWITARSGGEGAARDVCEMIMDAQNTLQSAFTKYLE